MPFFNDHQPVNCQADCNDRVDAPTVLCWAAGIMMAQHQLMVRLRVPVYVSEDVLKLLGYRVDPLVGTVWLVVRSPSRATRNCEGTAGNLTLQVQVALVRSLRLF